MALSPQVMLQLEKKLFDYFNQDVFRDDNGTAVSPAPPATCHRPGLLSPRPASPLESEQRPPGCRAPLTCHAGGFGPGLLTPPGPSPQSLGLEPSGALPPAHSAHWPRAEPPPSLEHRGHFPHQHPERPTVQHRPRGTLPSEPTVISPLREPRVLGGGLSHVPSPRAREAEEGARGQVRAQDALDVPRAAEAPRRSGRRPVPGRLGGSRVGWDRRLPGYRTGGTGGTGVTEGPEPSRGRSWREAG